MTPEDINKIVWIIIVLLAIGLTIAGLCNKCVIYYDAKDLGVTFLGIFLPILGIVLLALNVNIFDAEILNSIIRFGGGISSLLVGIWCLVKSFKYSIRHNRSIMLGLVIGIFKVAFLLFSIIAVIGYFAKVSDKKTTVREIFIVTILLLGFRAIAYAMINGERVYASKGWNEYEWI
jgi:hypothetical protein